MRGAEASRPAVLSVAAAVGRLTNEHRSQTPLH